MSIQEKELSPEIFKETIPKKEVKNVLFVINQRPSDEVDQPLYFYLILVVADLPYDHHERKRHLLFQISSSVIICARVWSCGDFGAKKRSKENRWGEYFSYSSILHSEDDPDDLRSEAGDSV